MATCEFHAKYADYLTEQVAVELVGRGGRDSRCWEEVWCTIKRIALCKNLERITLGEAENLNLIVFKLYPQFEEKIRAELNLQFRQSSNYAQDLRGEI